MDKLFKPLQIVDQATHRARVCRLYRNVLKHTKSWYIYEGVWQQYAWNYRQEFEANRNETHPAKIEALVENAEERFKKEGHYDPYICKYHTFYHVIVAVPYLEGGSKYQRNTPLPKWVFFCTNISFHLTTFRYETVIKEI